MTKEQLAELRRVATLEVSLGVVSEHFRAHSTPPTVLKLLDALDWDVVNALAELDIAKDALAEKDREIEQLNKQLNQWVQGEENDKWYPSE